MSQVLNINADQFEKEVLKSPVPVLVDFWAPWCRPCQMMGPVLDTIAHNSGEKVRIIKIDINNSANQELARLFQIMSIPSMKIFKEGKIVSEFVGMRSEIELSSELKKHE